MAPNRKTSLQWIRKHEGVARRMENTLAIDYHDPFTASVVRPRTEGLDEVVVNSTLAHYHARVVVELHPDI